MTHDEIRIAIAECCGWGGFENVEVGGEFLIGVPPHNEITEKLLGPRRISNWTPRCDVPDYPQDLNACAEFERTLADEEHATYACLLADMFNGTVPDIEELDGADKDNECRWSNYALSKAMRATPLQRCEAFLRVKGKWKEATP